MDEQRYGQQAQREITQDPSAHDRALARYSITLEDIDHIRRNAPEGRFSPFTFNHKFYQDPASQQIGPLPGPGWR